MTFFKRLHRRIGIVWLTFNRLLLKVHASDRFLSDYWKVTKTYEDLIFLLSLRFWSSLFVVSVDQLKGWEKAGKETRNRLWVKFRNKIVWRNFTFETFCLNLTPVRLWYLIIHILFTSASNIRIVPENINKKMLVQVFLIFNLCF